MAAVVTEEWLAAARRDPERTGIFVDFDGTLAPIVDEPAAARPWPGIPDLLGRLARVVGRVAVVSGRPVAFLVEHLAAATGAEFLGLYGLERAGAGGPATTPEAEPWRPVVDDVAAEAGRSAPAGVAVEHKGLTVTLHYRAAPHHEAWVSEFAGSTATRTGLVAHGGKMSIEMRPPVEVDKGTVIRQLADGLQVVLFAGDDLGDLPAFSVLAELRRAGSTTLGVASGGPETPDAVTEAADVTVDGPAGVAELLQALLG